ncbi:MAG: S-layer homology domain-containing protein [Dysosmobacter sp.]
MTAKTKSFSDSTIDDYDFYYKDSEYGKYALDELTFVAGDNFDKAVTLHFTAYYSSSRHVEGTLVINPSGTSETGDSQGDIRYYATYTTNVQINANDIARFFNKKYPTSTLQYVTLKDVPSTGSLYYNYYGVSKYGASKLKLTSSNCDNYNLYFSPSSTSQYALTELTYLPSGTNYCAQIPFTAYGSGSKSLSGTILISVNLSAVSEVYGVTPKGTAVTFPASAMYIAVSSASGQGLSSIQLLELPDSSVGTIYVGTGTSTKANTSTRYGYSSGSQRMGQLRFVPASGFTGSVGIPYVACNSSGTPIAAGKFSLGVVSNVKKFSDMTSSTWCYKYVVELSDAGVIDGYTDGSFKPDNTVTYGAALKLIMLAAGYPEQKPTDSNPFSGYLTKARSEGIITRSNVNLSAPITRLQVAQIAAGALKLDTTNLSSVQPFTDTTDPSVQALNAAGIVEGYFSGGKSTYKPNNTLTRGQVSAIVWRMEQLAD